MGITEWYMDVSGSDSSRTTAWRSVYTSTVLPPLHVLCVCVCVCVCVCARAAGVHVHTGGLSICVCGWQVALSASVCSFVCFHVVKCEWDFGCFLCILFDYLQWRAECVCVSAGGKGPAGSPGCPSITGCLSPSTGSICPR